MAKYTNTRSSLIKFMLIVGLIVAVFSVISDNLPYLGDGVTILEFIISYLDIMINSLPMWFILALLVGYLFAKDMKEAAFLGSIYTIASITFYFFYKVDTIPLPFKEQAIIYAIWFGTSAIGGILGGSLGFLSKKSKYALLILLGGLVFQLLVNGKDSWGDIVGISQNLTYCLVILVISLYLVIFAFKRNRDQNVEYLKGDGSYDVL
ncbi:hypothetical protein [Cytobacillus oceanisediminis]|uniref:hypothetical protein n=1 Tax=Cytobacillus oceanisediminis TaxID=665099 RepID=UPI00215B3419|nr:hypothetical protein [Cytobacillus oceanisediminis]